MTPLILEHLQHYRIRLPDGAEARTRYDADWDGFVTDSHQSIPRHAVAFVGPIYARRLHPVAQTKQDQRRGVRP